MGILSWLANDSALWLRVVLAAVGGYLMGAIPIGYLVGKAWGVDVTKTASGRTGGTNVWRATGRKLPPLLTVLGDLAKGMVAVLLARYLVHSELAAAAAGAAAVMGHNWSVLLGFRGGAGGITAGAALMALSPLAAAVVIPLAIAALYLSRYASVGTLTVAVGGALVLGLLSLLAPTTQVAGHLIFGVASSAAVVIALRPNLQRLAAGTERRITLW